MSKIILDSNEYENLLAKLSTIPALVSAINKEIYYIQEKEEPNIKLRNPSPKSNASDMTYILEEYLQQICDKFSQLFKQAEDCVKNERDRENA